MDFIDTRELFDAFIELLKEELVPAMGCTEPIAVAYVASKAREVLGMMPERIEIFCSSNIAKNVKSVTVPNTGGRKGIAVAAIAGIIGGDANAHLNVLESVTEVHWRQIQAWLDERRCKTILVPGIEGLFIEARLYSGKANSTVAVKDTHMNIIKITQNGQVLLEKPAETSKPGGTQYHLLALRAIYDFATTIELERVAPMIEQQIRLNSAIADEGLRCRYGAAVGRTLMEHSGNDVRIRARARAAAGSDARMSGCSMPVVIVSGSGNQGITVSVPVIEYARELKAPREKLIRALLLANLVALKQKGYIGKLSAYCGAVSAAVGSGAAITYLKGGDYETISCTISNAIAVSSGMVCDGAKSSCAAKIAVAVESALLAHDMSMDGRFFPGGDGLVGKDIEATIRNFGYVGSVGMHGTDIEIMKVMLDN